MKKLLLILLSLCLLALPLTGCAETDAPDETAAADTVPGTDPAGGTAAVPAGEAWYAKYGLDAHDPLLRVNGETVEAQEFFFLADYYHGYVSYYYGDLPWDALLAEGMTVLDFVRDQTVNSLVFYHIFSTAGADFGGAMTAEDEAAIAALRQEYIDGYFGGDEAAFLAYLESAYIDDAAFTRLNFASNHFYEKCFSALYPDTSSYVAAYGADDLMTFIEDSGTMKVAHILLKTVDDSYEPLDDETVAGKTALAQDLYAQLQAGADFWALLEQYGEDPGMLSNPEGYLINSTTNFVQEFKDGAAALSEGEYGLVESLYGWHILLRCPLTDADLETVAEAACWDAYDDLIDTWCLSAEVETTAAYDAIDLTKLYEAAA